MSGKRKKYFKFYLFALLVWVISVLIFGMLGWYANDSNTEIYASISGIIVVFGIYGIPIVIFLSMIIQLAEYIIYRIPSKFDK